MSDVPDEIWLEVLSKLPVVDLLRFRCVSKPWKCLIDSNEFITHHLNHSLNNTNSNLSLILESRNLYSADFDVLIDTNRARFQQLSHPLLPTKLGIVKVLGSCHGLLVLSNDPFHTSTILWNPSVRRFHELPFESLECWDYHLISHGFGYDVVNDDYKLVRLVQVRGDGGIQVKVYSLKSDSWRRIPYFPYDLKYRSIPGELANGALHWNVTRKGNSATLAIAFDLGTEEYRLVPLPEFAVNTPSISLFVLGGCLGFIYYDNDYNVNLWIMKEYGVQESWSFYFTFERSHVVNFVTPIAYSKCNRKVLLGLQDQVLMWYDLDNKSTDVPMVEMTNVIIYDMYTCLPSLVLLNNGTRDIDLITDTTKTQKRNAKKMSSICLM